MADTRYDSSAPADASTLADEVATKLELGTALGKFVIVDELGRGGMGVVYLGHDQQLDRLAAIKVVKTQGAAAQTRMLREARAMARVSHPNVVHVYEVGEYQQDVFVAMEFVDGSSLREWLAAAERTPADILRCYLEAGCGLAAIHAAGLVHRDFKPDNVMVARDGRVRVLDLGLAADRGPAVDADASESSRRRQPGRAASILTSLGGCLGTPAYMAPEQYNGESVDARTDQFAFCVSLWEALHGERPFQGANLVALANSVTRGQLPRPANRDLGPELHAVITRGLAIDPNDRWLSIDALLTALERELAGLVATKRKSDARVFRRRGVALTLTVVGCVAMGVFMLAPPDSQPSQDTLVPQHDAEAVQAGLDDAYVYLDEGQYREVLESVMEVRTLVASTMSPGDDKYCGVGLSVLQIADQLTDRNALPEARMVYAVGIRFAQDCPYLDRPRILSHRDAARVEQVALE